MSFQTFRSKLSDLRKRRVVRWGLDAALFLLLFAAISAWQNRSHLSGPAPAVALPTLSGNTVSLADLKGRPVLVQFFAPWCGVCEAEADNLARVQRLVGDRAHVVTIASAWKSEGEVRAFAERNGLTVPVLLDPGDQAEAFRVQAYPTTYFLDRDGQVKGSATGYTTTAGLLLRLML